MRESGIVVGVVLAVVASNAWAALELNYRVVVPKRFSEKVLASSPTGQSEAERYREKHQIYWWACVCAKADGLSTQCSYFASGTPGASEGAADGGRDATQQIKRRFSKRSIITW